MLFFNMLFLQNCSLYDDGYKRNALEVLPVNYSAGYTGSVDHYF